MKGSGIYVSQPIIFVIDDDASVRKALQRLIGSVGMTARTFASAEDFLEADLPLPDCLILDLCMPGMSGLELQQRLIASGKRVPIVFITAHDDERSRQAAMAACAVDFLRKPFEEQALLDVLSIALTHTLTPGDSGAGQ